MKIPYLLPYNKDVIALYITHLWRSGLKTSSIKTYISAISYKHKINKLDDPCNCYYIRQVVKGVENRANASKPKLRPISRNILHNMISIIPNLYEQLLFKAIFITSYYCCLRAGEAVISRHAHSLL